jgi:transcriptional regulator with XRE-family HTH domain
MDIVYDDQNFYKAFTSDLDKAQALVLIHSPFIAVNRLEKIQSSLARCIRRRVRVCAFLRSPRDAEELSAVRETAKRLLWLGAHVTYRKVIHEKVAIVDEHILWDGSLNILSQSLSSERMTRWSNREKVYAAIIKHRLRDCETCAARSAGTEYDELRSIGAKMTKRRKLFGLTQTELGRNSGVPQSAISNIEVGRPTVSIDTLIRICKELDGELRFIPWYFLPALDALCDEKTLEQCRVAMDTSAIDIAVDSLKREPALIELVRKHNERECARLLLLRLSLAPTNQR